MTKLTDEADGFEVCKGLQEGSGITAETLKEPETFQKLAAELNGRYSEEEIGEALRDVIELTEAGQLFTEDTYECLIDEVKKRKTVVKALCLHIAHDCNLACRYCFAEEGEYHGRRALMSYEVGKKALDFLIASSGGRHNLEVDFFGGEPLMNWQVVKDLVAYGREQEKIHDKHFRFTLTTNGVLLNDEVQAFVNREMDNVVLSLDGRREINDRMRPFRNGAGSYDLIVPKFQRLADSRGQERYYVRGTFTRENLDFAEDILHFDPNRIAVSMVGWKIYRNTAGLCLGVMLGIFIILLIWMDGRDLSMLMMKEEEKEKRPISSIWLLLTALGIAVVVLAVRQYNPGTWGYYFSHVEFVIGGFLIVAFGGGFVLEWVKKRRFYLHYVLKINQLDSKYQSNMMVILMLFAVHFFALSYISTQIAEVLPLDKEKGKYPYDTVWMAQPKDMGAGVGIGHGPGRR